MLEDAVEHGGDDERGLYPVALDELQPLPGVEPGLQNRGVPAAEIDEQSEQPSDVEQRHAKEAYLGRAGGAREESDTAGDRLLREGHRLRTAGRAAREEHDGR